MAVDAKQTHVGSLASGKDISITERVTLQRHGPQLGGVGCTMRIVAHLATDLCVGIGRRIPRRTNSGCVFVILHIVYEACAGMARLATGASTFAGTARREDGMP